MSEEKKGDWLEKLFAYGAAAAILSLIFLFVGTIIAVITAIGLGIYGAYRIYALYNDSPTKEADRQNAEVQRLHQIASGGLGRTITKKDFGFIAVGRIGPTLPRPLLEACIETVLETYDLEQFDGNIPPPPQITNEIELGRYKDRLARSASLNDDQLRLAAEAIGDALNRCLRHLPRIVEGESQFNIPVTSYIHDLPKAVQDITRPFFAEGMPNIFKRTCGAIERNFADAKHKGPTDYKGDDVVDAFLRGTRLGYIFDVSVPLDVPQNITYEHTVITGGTGQGKTVLLEHLILRDLNDPERPSIVVIDSQQKLIAKMSRLAAVHQRPLIVFDAKDGPALNVFDVNASRTSKYSEAGQEQILNHTLETFGYLFNSLLGADLTVKQTALFNYIIMLMLKMPETMGRNATLLDIMELMQQPEHYLPAIEALNPVARDFFLNDFMRAKQNQYAQTKEQIRYRLHAILGNTSLNRLFLAPYNTIDFFEEFAQGAIILIDTDKNHLGAKNSSYLGRIAITLMLQAILERGATSGEHTPVHMYIDEAGEYFDTSIDTFLTEARKHKAGITLAHQHLGQMTTEFYASVATNTGTKYAGGLSSKDARTLAADMRTTPEFLLKQPRLTFACYIRNATPQAISVPVEVGAWDDEPTVREERYRAFREANRKRLAAPPPPVVPEMDEKPEPAPEVRPEPPEQPSEPTQSVSEPETAPRPSRVASKPTT